MSQPHLFVLHVETQASRRIQFWFSTDRQK